MHKVPTCCGYSSQKTGFSCLHSVAVIVGKYSASNEYKYIDEKNLSLRRKSQYEDVVFSLPQQVAVDAILIDAKRLVLLGENVAVPKALLPLEDIP